MAVIIDREQNEVRTLGNVVDWRGKKVLEIGCGDGRLTRRLARFGPQIEAIDPLPENIKAARQQLPCSFASRVSLRVGESSRLEYPHDTFDLVLFSWSL